MPTTQTDRATILEQFLMANLRGEVTIATDLVTEDVVGWSPNLNVTSRKELGEAFGERTDAFTNIDSFVDVRTEGDRAVAEWYFSADHTGPVAIDEETYIEPTGKRVFLAGATIAEFDGPKIRAFRHYFDDLALLEQLLTSQS